MATLEYSNPVRIRREELGITRFELAVQAETSTTTLSRIELEGHIPNAATLKRIADALGTTTDALLPGAERVS